MIGAHDLGAYCNVMQIVRLCLERLQPLALID